MKTVFVYPGLNGLIKESDRFRFLNIPQVQVRLAQVQDLFSKQGLPRFDFQDYFKNDFKIIYSVENMSKAATAICALQVGVSEYLISKNIKPDYTLGCSLGDLARAVVSGVCEFEACVLGYIDFAGKLSGIEKIGANVGVSKLSTEEPFTENEIDLMRSMGLDISVMTPFFLNIGGRYAELEKLQILAQEKKWRFVKILDYPAHSRYIADFVQAAASTVSDMKLNKPNNRMFSSLSCEELTDAQVIKNELLLNMVRPLRWGEAMKKIESIGNDLRFINIGPCSSLTKMSSDLSLKNKFYEPEFFD